MKVLVIGSGGREHALIWKLKQSSWVTELFCAPGNGGTAQIAQNVDIPASDIDRLKDWALSQKMDFVVVGPELPLSLGIVDQLQKVNIPVFGVNQRASQLESSKVFTKKFLQNYGVPTAKALVCESHGKALEALKEFSYPLVIKADGLAAGKGVKICQNEKEAKETLSAIMQKKIFGAAGEKIVIEEYLSGEEISYMGFVDGKRFMACPACQDHKRVGDGDKGPNTGGMGAYSPVPWCDKTIEGKIHHLVVEPVLRGFKEEGIDYRGILYIGLIISKGTPTVLEFNVRWGDPEAQVLLFKLKSDLFPILQAVTQGGLDKMMIEWDTRPALCVVMVSQGYPDSYEQGFEIKGLGTFSSSDEMAVFHAGTVLKDHRIFTQGGRVLNCVALGNTFKEAREKVYKTVSRISWKNSYYRKDIGDRVCQK